MIGLEILVFPSEKNKVELDEYISKIKNLEISSKLMKERFI